MENIVKIIENQDLKLKNNLSNTTCIFLTILYFHYFQFIYDYVIYKLKRYKSRSDLYLFNSYNTLIHI